VIASPWSRGGYVNSEVFDHTSSLQFLEHFLSNKTKKEIREPNITEWRRTVCGNLTSVFRPWNNEKIELPEFLERDPFIESIHKAQFKKLPDNFKALTEEEIKAINTNPHKASYMAKQEAGIRSACSLPYVLSAEATLNKNNHTVSIAFTAGARQHQMSGGAPFTVYAWNLRNKQVQCRSYAVKTFDTVKDEWLLDEFENGEYLLRVYGPNGFFREFKGSAAAQPVHAKLQYENLTKIPGYTGNIEIVLHNNSHTDQTVLIADNAYKAAPKTVLLKAGKQQVLRIDTQKYFHWYDLSVTVKNTPHFAVRFAGHVETNSASKTDPFMGQVV